MKTVIVLNTDQMGHGERALGHKILKTFLQKSRATRELEAIVFYNDGVKLLVEGSPVLTELTLLLENGVDLLPCVTCVEHYGLELAVGEVSTMDEIMLEMERAEKVVTL